MKPLIVQKFNDLPKDSRKKVEQLVEAELEQAKKEVSRLPKKTYKYLVCYAKVFHTSIGSYALPYSCITVFPKRIRSEADFEALEDFMSQRHEIKRLELRILNIIKLPI